MKKIDIIKENVLADYGNMVFDTDYGFRHVNQDKIEWLSPSVAIIKEENEDTEKR